jgi:hypothetical protein
VTSREVGTHAILNDDHASQLHTEETGRKRVYSRKAWRLYDARDPEESERTRLITVGDERPVAMAVGTGELRQHQTVEAVALAPAVNVGRIAATWLGYAATTERPA